MFDEFSKERDSLEERWLKSYRQWKGEYDSDIACGIPPDRSRAYPRLTRVKGLHLTSRILDVVADRTYKVVPSPAPSVPNEVLQEILSREGMTPDKVEPAIMEWAADQADNLQRRIDDQLAENNYDEILNRVVKSAVMFGIGVAKGPVVTERDQRNWVRGPETGEMTYTVSKVLVPCIEHVSVWDFYPDLSASSVESMDKIFERRRLGRHQLTELANSDPEGGSGYRTAVIKEWLKNNTKGNYRRPSYQRELDIEGNPEDRAYELIICYVSLSGQELKDAGLPVSERQEYDSVFVEVTLLDDKVIRMRPSPYAKNVNFYHMFILDSDDDGQLVGESFPESVRDAQLGICSTARQLSDNAAAVCGPMAEVDVSQLVKGQNLTLRAFQVFVKQSDTMNPSTTRAVNNITIDSRITELLAVHRMWRDLMDDESMLPPIAMGNVQGEALRTAAGTSQLAGAATMTLRNMVRSLDRYTQSVINAMVEWNYTFNPSSDIIGDATVVIDKTISLVAKELRGQRMIDIIGSMPPDMRQAVVNQEKAAEYMFRTSDLPADVLVKPDADIEQAQQAEVAAAQEARAVALDLDKARAEKLRASAQAQIASIEQRGKQVDIQGAKALADTEDKLSEADRKTAELLYSTQKVGGQTNGAGN